MVTQRRAAFDIGSGGTKLQVADVAAGKLVRVVFAVEVPVMFALSWKTHGHLSDQVMLNGLGVLHELCAQADRHGATAYTAIATEVFRKAPNGAAFLEQVLRATGLAVEVVTQDAEARLGFLTACAISPRPRSSIIAWDSGGGSFQISAERSGALAVYSGALGSSVVTALMVEAVQRASLSAKCTPNPVSVEQAEELVRILTTALPPAPTWLRGSAGVSAIGGPNSLFNSAAMVIRSESIGGDCADAAAPGSLADAEGFVVGARPVPISCKDVRSAVYARCGESDETLEALGYSEPGLLVPKLCLLVAVMEHAQLERIEFLPAIGACPGVLVDEERFGCGERSWPPARLPS